MPAPPEPPPRPPLELGRGHRQRSRRPRSEPVRNGSELAAALGCPLEILEAELERLGIRYHKDSAGEIWSSQPLPER